MIRRSLELRGPQPARAPVGEERRVETERDTVLPHAELRVAGVAEQRVARVVGSARTSG